MCRQSATVCLVKSPTRQHRAIGPPAERRTTLANPRCRRGKRHPFVAALLIVCSAVVTGATSFAAIPENMAALRSFAINHLRDAGHTNIAAGLRTTALRPYEQPRPTPPGRSRVNAPLNVRSARRVWVRAG
jgi:hypothetical protein